MVSSITPSACAPALLSLGVVVLGQNDNVFPLVSVFPPSIQLDANPTLALWEGWEDQSLAVSTGTATTSTFTIPPVGSSSSTAEHQANSYGVTITPDLTSGQTLYCSLACAAASGSNVYALPMFDNDILGHLAWNFSSSCPVEVSHTLNATRSVFLLAQAVSTSDNGLTDASITCSLSPLSPTSPTTPAPAPSDCAPAPPPSNCPFGFGSSLMKALTHWWNQ